MLTTAKSFQLLDASGINISPVTDITSLYYEVEREQAGNTIVTRKYVYSGFPVAVNFDQDVCTNIGKIPLTNYIQSSLTDYKIVDSSNNDIIISNISTGIIPGTTYRQFQIKNYNLSEILTSYTTREKFDNFVDDVSGDLRNIDASITILDTCINNLYDSITYDIVTLPELLNLDVYIPNKFYLIEDYYYGGTGCMFTLTDNTFAGPNANNKKYLLVKAFDKDTLDGKIYEMYDTSLNNMHVYGNYIIDQSKLKIIYLKDENNNEAFYDFINLQYKPFGDTFYHTFENLSSTQYKNNKIRISPYGLIDDQQKMIPIFKGNSSDSIIENNYIDIDNSMVLLTNGPLIFKNNIVKNNNHIDISKSGSYTIDIQNMFMNNNNSLIIKAGYTLGSNITYKNLYIGVNNNIELLDAHASSINSLIIKSNNSLSLDTTNTPHDALTNITILNGCNIQKLKSNTIFDKVTTNFIQEENSVYLFGQNVYAASFNTFK